MPTNNWWKKTNKKTNFCDTVTHELRTPITAIKAASEILHDDDDIPEELRKTVFAEHYLRIGSIEPFD